MTLDPGASLPDGTRLVHIGPHKTGTTALQASLWGSRPALLAQGVRHVGRARNPSTAARAVVDQPSPYSVGKPPSISDWHALVREFRRAREPRVVVSSEFFAYARPDTIRRIVDDLDPARIHVAVTVRALAKVIPSMWQQNVQAGTTTPFGEWVRGVADRSNAAFWGLERHDELVERWAAVVGADRVTAVVVDETDHPALLRAFEGLLGVSSGTLADQPDLMNRSLTLPEAEAVRAFNVAFSAEKLPRDLHARTMRFGAAQHMKRRVPPRDEPRVTLPGWAVEPIAAIQAEVCERIRASNVRVIGTLDALTQRDGGGRTATDIVDGIPAEVAGSMGMALLIATGAVRSAVPSPGLLKVAEPAEVARVPTYQLFGTIAGRTWRSLVSRLPRIRRGPGPS